MSRFCAIGCFRAVFRPFRLLSAALAAYLYYTFAIDAVRDFRPAGTLGCDCRGDCYTVVIRGEEKHLFFERVDPLFSGRVGRWFVEKTV